MLLITATPNAYLRLAGTTSCSPRFAFNKFVVRKTNNLSGPSLKLFAFGDLKPFCKKVLRIPKTSQTLSANPWLKFFAKLFFKKAGKSGMREKTDAKVKNRL